MLCEVAHSYKLPRARNSAASYKELITPAINHYYRKDNDDKLTLLSFTEGDNSFRRAADNYYTKMRNMFNNDIESGVIHLESSSIEAHKILCKRLQAILGDDYYHNSIRYVIVIMTFLSFLSLFLMYLYYA